jgi:predicted ATPase with chaperone activity
MALRGQMSDDARNEQLIQWAMIEAALTGKRIQFVIPRGMGKARMMKRVNRILLELADKHPINQKETP